MKRILNVQSPGLVVLSKRSARIHLDQKELTSEELQISVNERNAELLAIRSSA
jgi:hypothetical protein